MFNWEGTHTFTRALVGGRGDEETEVEDEQQRSFAEGVETEHIAAFSV